MAALFPNGTAAFIAGTAPSQVTGRAATGEAHYRRPRTRREYIVAALPFETYSAFGRIEALKACLRYAASARA